MQELPNICCQLEFKRALKDKQVVVLTDGCSKAAKHEAMTDVNLEETFKYKRKTFTTVAFDSEIYRSTVQLKRSNRLSAKIFFL